MIEVLKITVDFGILILIWLVQLVVYPGFRYYSSSDLLKWHGKYTVGISSIVAPLMLIQLVLHSLSLNTNPAMLGWVSFVLLITCWIMTFGWAMPLHAQINHGNQVRENVLKLISMNKYRTIAWSVIFLISLIQWFLQLN